jgi:hypothetical protein
MDLIEIRSTPVGDHQVAYTTSEKEKVGSDIVHAIQALKAR